MKKYDLIYVPADTYMLMTGVDETIQIFIKLKKPASVILLEDRDKHVRVLHEDRDWLIEKTHLRGLND